MQVSVEVGQGLERSVKVVIPYERVEEEILKRIKELQPKMNVPGFRQGKVPERVVRRKHGKYIQQDVAEALSRTTVFDAIKEAALEPLTRPEIEVLNLGTVGPLEYVAKFEIEPPFELASMEGMSFESLNSEVADQNIDETLEKLRQQHTDWAAVERIAVKGDRITMDFEGSINGELFDGGAATNFDMELGAGNMIPGFEDALMGCKADEERTIDVPFPKDYHVESLAGKASQFKIKVHQVSEKALPELNDEFALRFGLQDGGIAALREQIKERLQQELNNRLQSLNKEAVLKKMVELNEMELPMGLVEEELQRLIQQRQMFAQQMGMDKMPIDEEAMRKQAQERVKLSILVNKYAKAHALEASEEEVRKLVVEAASTYESPSQIVKWYYEKPERLGNFVTNALENVVVEHILSKGTAETKQLNYDEVIEKQPTLV